MRTAQGWRKPCFLGQQEVANESSQDLGLLFRLLLVLLKIHCRLENAQVDQIVEWGKQQAITKAQDAVFTEVGFTTSASILSNPTESK